MNVFEIITPKELTFYLYVDTNIKEALDIFEIHKYSVLPIIDGEGSYITTISEGDILRYIKNVCEFDYYKAKETKVIDIEKYRPYESLSQLGSFDDILDLIQSQNFIPIVDDRKKYIGIIRRKEILQYLKKYINK